MFGTAFTQQPSSGASGGLFGGGSNNTNTQGGGLFGGGMGGGGQSLFGGSTNPPASGFGNNNTQGGLFGGSQPAQSVGGGLFGGQQQQPSQNTQGGGLFGGQVASGGGGLFGGQATSGGGGLFGGGGASNNQPSPFSLNGPSQPSGGMFGGGGAQPSSGGLFGGGQTFGQTQTLGLAGNNTNGMGGQTSQFGAFGGSTQPSQGGLFGTAAGQGQSTGGLFGTPAASGGLFGGQQQQTQQPQSGGGLFGMPSQTNNNTGGGLFGVNTNNTATGGLLSGGFNNMSNNNRGLLGGSNNNTQTGFGFNNQIVGSFGQNNNSNNVAQPFVAKKSANDSLSSKPSEKNLVYAISNGSDKCIVEIALVQRKMVKAGQLQPNPQSGIPQFGQAQQQQGGLFGGGNQNLQQTGTFGGGGMFGAAPQQQPGSLFGGQPAASSQAIGGGGLFGQQNQPQPGSFGLFGQTPSTNSGGLLGNTTQGGGLFGQQTQAPQSGGLFGGAGLGQQVGSATGGGLFGTQNSQQTGGLFGGQQQQQAQGGLFGAPGPSTGGGLFGGPTAAPPINSGFSLGGTNTATGLFGNSTSTNQPTSGGLFGGQSQSTGGLFGASTQQTGGLFGQTAPSGGLFGQMTSVNNTQTNMAGGQFGVTQTSQFGYASSQTSDQLGRQYQSLLSYLEITSQQEPKKPILDEDLEARWVYGKARDSDSLGYYQKREGDKQSESSFTASEYQVLYGYQQKQKELGQFKKLALRDESDRKEDIRKTFSAFTGGKQQDLGQQLKSQSIQVNRVTAKSEKLSASSQGTTLVQQMENCLDFIKQGSKLRVKIPFRPRYTYGDVKNYILEAIIDNDLTLEGARQFRLQARLKGPDQPPKSLKENEKILSSQIYSSIDYIELVEKAGCSDQSQNSSVVFDQNILEASYQSGRNNLELEDKITQNAAAPPAQKRFTIPSEFKVSPSREILEKLGDSALQRVENFSIENSFVKIAYEDPVNLLNADLTGLFFGENKISIEGVPSGDRINKPCVIQFLKFGQKQLDDRKTPLEVQKLVEKLVRKMNLDLVQPYDVKSTCLIYRQESFN